ncbi:MAG TPA: DUF3237 domain-containing protein [Vicinamibacteria bacterium]|nr:DUF3237 domain-containing protein [Vicinamibacteria bacterium]
MSELRSRPLFTIRMTLHPMHELGQTPMGRRRIVPVREGTFEGDRLRGTVRTDAGGDWLLLRADGTYQMDVRLTLETDDGALVLMCYRGVRAASEEVSARIARGETVPASEYYLRSTPFFETSDPRYAWLNNLVAVGVGDRRPDGVSYEVFEIL